MSIYESGNELTGGRQYEEVSMLALVLFAVIVSAVLIPGGADAAAKWQLKHATYATARNTPTPKSLKVLPTGF